jgi:hypothetical protein
LQNMRIGKYEVVSNDELPFYGVLVAKKWDKYWYPLVEVYDKTKEIWYQSNLPYALWIDNGRLLLSIVFIWNGWGSGEGTESVVVLGENGNWELIWCYYYIPDIYGHEGNLRFSYKNYTNSVNYISTLLKGFTSYPLEQCDHSVQVWSINHSFGL